MVQDYPLSQAALLDLVGLIYESINADTPWYSFADNLRQTLGDVLHLGAKALRTFGKLGVLCQ